MDMDLVNSLVHNLCPHSTLFPSIYTEFNSVQITSSKLHSAFPGYPRDVIDQIPPCSWGAPSLVWEIDIELGGLVGAEAVKLETVLALYPGRVPLTHWSHSTLGTFFQILAQSCLSSIQPHGGAKIQSLSQPHLGRWLGWALCPFSW